MHVFPSSGHTAGTTSPATGGGQRTEKKKKIGRRRDNRIAPRLPTTTSINKSRPTSDGTHFSSLQIPRLWRRILEISNSNFGVYLYLGSKTLVKTRANIIVNALLLPFRNLMSKCVQIYRQTQFVLTCVINRLI